MPFRAQRELLALGDQAPVGDGRVGIEDPTRGVKSHAQVIGGRLGAQVGPKHLHGLLSVEAVVIGGQGQQLDQPGRLPELPRTLFDVPGLH
jgi:hypothetical protein